MVNRLLLGWVLILATVVIWPALLPLPLLAAGSMVAVLLKRHPLLLGLLLGGLFGQLMAHRLHGELRWLSQGPQQLQATLVSVQSGAALYQRSRWLVESANGEDAPLLAAKQVELGWYRPPPLQIGKSYLLEVVIKPDRSRLNRIGFNLTRHRLAKNITAYGSVRGGQLIAENLFTSALSQADLRQRLAALTADLPRADMIRALSLGDTSLVTPQRWQQLRQAGLIHLLAISGLHLSIVAGLTLSLATWAQRRWLPSATGRYQPLLWGLTAAAVAAYGAAAGFAVPTLRATVTVLLAMWLLWRAASGQPWELLLRVAAVLLLLQPMASLAAGFWLSFGAVITIITLAWVWPQPRAWLQKLLWLLLLQMALTLTVNLLQGLWFDQFSIHGLWANLLLLPYFSLVALPLCLLCVVAVLAGAPSALLQLADWALLPIAWVAQRAGSWAWGHGQLSSAASWSLLLLLLAVLMVCCGQRRLSRRWRIRATALVPAAVVAITAGLLWLKPKPLWQLDMIDVGQGSALLLSHQHRHLLVDTGAAFASGYSFAASTLVPLLESRDITQLELLLITHGDNDHAGGVRAIRQALPVRRHIGFGGESCMQGPTQFGELSLSWQQAPLAGNDGSCVLLISSSQHKVLLPGDIERAGEQAWLASTLAGPVAVMLAPHHGSATSSSDAFVSRTAPEWLLVSAGRNNRWHFPKAEVVARYRAVGSQIVSSGDSGQVQLRLFADGQIQVVRQRQDRAPWWYNQQ
ncbi:DNA internalization-related competence protein ComEC/Rec2 [Ferrimonas senticii]|uniref:DNA internalization-related competence protein ComEC/Rec2 n=1 Tax=Ferrimonas senticii TaxID=394566 RepID=UPI000481EFDC|nr:DNA internalization-related competence protein ComEC/Rec2 [Ferrimonas senticii]